MKNKRKEVNINMKQLKRRLKSFLYKYHLKNTFFKKLSLLVFHDQFLTFAECGSNFQNVNDFSLFAEKFRVVESTVKAIYIYYRKRQKKFAKHLVTKNLTESQSVVLLFKLLNLVKITNRLSLQIKNLFGTRFVGKRALLLINSFLDSFSYMNRCWLEFERAGVFRLFLSKKNTFKLLRYLETKTSFRKKKSRYRSRFFYNSKFSQDFRRIGRVGYVMSNLKLTDNLFFWHIFTRKKLKQNLWLVRSKKFFKNFLFFKQQKQLNKRVLSLFIKKMDVFSMKFFFYKVFNFFLVSKLKNRNKNCYFLKFFFKLGGFLFNFFCLTFNFNRIFKLCSERLLSPMALGALSPFVFSFLQFFVFKNTSYFFVVFFIVFFFFFKNLYSVFFNKFFNNYVLFLLFFYFKAKKISFNKAGIT